MGGIVRRLDKNDICMKENTYSDCKIRHAMYS